MRDCCLAMRHYRNKCARTLLTGTRILTYVDTYLPICPTCASISSSMISPIVVRR